MALTIWRHDCSVHLLATYFPSAVSSRHVASMLTQKALHRLRFNVALCVEAARSIYVPSSKICIIIHFRMPVLEVTGAHESLVS